MELFKLFGTVVMDNAEAIKNIDETTAKADSSSVKVKSAFGKIGGAIKSAFSGKEPKEFESQMADITETVSDQESELDQLNRKSEDLYRTHGKNATEAKECAKQIEAMSTELGKNKKKLDDADDAAEQFEKSVKDVGEEAERTGGKLSSFLGGVAKVCGGLVTGASALVTALASTAEESREYRNEMAKLDTAFVTNGHSSESAKNTYMELNSILGDSGQAVEASNHLSMLCQTEQELAEWTDICTGVYATFGASLPIEGLTEAANETAKVGQLTGPLADALNWAGVSEDEFNEKLAACTTEQERQALITSTLTELYSDASKQYKETNKDVIESNKAQARMTDTVAKFGKIAEPVVTKFKNAAANMMEKLLPVAEMLATQFVPPLMDMIPLITEIIESILPVLVDLAAQLLPFISQIIEQILPQAVSLIQTLLPIIKQVIEQVLPPLLTVLQELLPPLMDIVEVLLPPIAGIIGDIMKVLGPFIEEIARLTNDGLGALNPVIETCASLFSDTLGKAIEDLGPTFDWIKGVIEGLNDFVTGVFTGDWELAWDGVVKIFEETIGALPGILEGVMLSLLGISKNNVPAIGQAITETVLGDMTSDVLGNGIKGIGGAAIYIDSGTTDTSANKGKKVGTVTADGTVPEMAEGGVLKKGQVGLLEGTGAEAVVPLEKNREWISRVAADMNAAVGGGQEMKEMREAFDSFVDELPEILVEAFAKMKFDVNSREFARMVKAVN